MGASCLPCDSERDALVAMGNKLASDILFWNETHTLFEVVFATKHKKTVFFPTENSYAYYWVDSLSGWWEFCDNMP